MTPDAHLGAIAALWLFASCAHPAPPPLLSRSIRTELGGAHGSAPAPREQREVVVKQACALLAGGPLVVDGLTFPPDPVGFVRAAYWAAGLDLFAAEVAADTGAGGVEIIYRSAAHARTLHGSTPRPGDLVFFDRNTRGTELYPAHVAVVERVHADGTVAAIGLFGDSPARVALNLRQPDRNRAEDGKRLNDTLDGEKKATAARLFRAFADPFGS